MSLNRPRQEYWKNGMIGQNVRPHRGRFEALQNEVEESFDAAAKRAELAAQCFGWINPSPKTDDCYCEAPNYEVTPGGLSYQDAALQCLLGGCRESLETISRRAALRARAGCLAGAQTREGSVPAGYNAADVRTMAGCVMLVVLAAWRALRRTK